MAAIKLRRVREFAHWIGEQLDATGLSFRAAAPLDGIERLDMITELSWRV